MNWIFLLVASLFEVAWAVALKYSDGFTKPFPATISAIGMVLSVVFLGLAVRTIPLGTAYAIWTGIGAGLTAMAAIFLFGESLDPSRILCLGLIITGTIGLKLTTI